MFEKLSSRLIELLEIPDFISVYVVTKAIIVFAVAWIWSGNPIDALIIAVILPVAGNLLFAIGILIAVSVSDEGWYM